MQCGCRLVCVVAGKLCDITQKLLGLRDAMGTLEARKCERSALAELASTLHAALNGQLGELEQQLGGLVAVISQTLLYPQPGAWWVRWLG